MVNSLKIDRDGFFLSTGRHIRANHRLVSIPIVECYSDDQLEFGEGYDGGFEVHDPKRHTKESAKEMLTPSEGIEVCDAMIAAWKRRKATLKAMVK